MKHLIVVAHPVLDSFTMGVARAYATELEALGHSQITFDLYRRGFDPVLAARELLTTGSEQVAGADVEQAQEAIRDADVLTAIYPLWWLSMPAILKGYVDRVFARGFAYESHEGIVRGLLSGKRAVLVTVSGAPLPLLVQSGGWNAVQMLQDTHVFRSVGFKLLEHLHFDQIVPGLSKTVIEKHFERVRTCARNLFPAGSLAVS
jgi:NAD(P)H dehydrogenase (quinone)